jgi:hypothetical protein
MFDRRIRRLSHIAMRFENGSVNYSGQLCADGVSRTAPAIKAGD